MRLESEREEKRCPSESEKKRDVSSKVLESESEEKRCQQHGVLSVLRIAAVVASAGATSVKTILVPYISGVVICATFDGDKKHHHFCGGKKVCCKRFRFNDKNCSGVQRNLFSDPCNAKSACSRSQNHLTVPGASGSTPWGPVKVRGHKSPTTQALLN